MAGLTDPSDKALDAAADGAFGGKQNTNRRAGYSKTITVDGVEYTEAEWLIRLAKKDATLASSEGRKIVEHYERILNRLRNPSDAVLIAVGKADVLAGGDVSDERMASMLAAAVNAAIDEENVS